MRSTRSKGRKDSECCNRCMLKSASEQMMVNEETCSGTFVRRGDRMLRKDRRVPRPDELRIATLGSISSDLQWCVFRRVVLGPIR